MIPRAKQVYMNHPGGGCEVEVERSRSEVRMEKDGFMVRTRRRRTQWDSGSGTLISHHQQAGLGIRQVVDWQISDIMYLQALTELLNGVLVLPSLLTTACHTEHSDGEGSYPLG